jgi:hypothetical protein
MPEEPGAGTSFSQNDGAAPPNILFIMVNFWQDLCRTCSNYGSVASSLLITTPPPPPVLRRAAGLISGLYSQQSWLTQTIKAAPFTNLSISPVLNHAYPTYGRLLKNAGFSTPFPPPSGDRLDAYSFEGLTCYDPTGAARSQVITAAAI